MTEQFFSYRVRDGGEVLKIGKGKVNLRPVSTARMKALKQRVEQYLEKRYGDREWTNFDFIPHTSESAAFKQERRTTDEHEERIGALPPWNAIRGGSGGAVHVRCKAILANGKQCMESAAEGNYGYCYRHRR